MRFITLLRKVKLTLTVDGIMIIIVQLASKAVAKLCLAKRAPILLPSDSFAHVGIPGIVPVLTPECQ